MTQCQAEFKLTNEHNNKQSNQPTNQQTQWIAIPPGTEINNNIIIITNIISIILTHYYYHLMHIWKDIYHDMVTGFERELVKVTSGEVI